MKNDLTAEVIEGSLATGETNPYLFSSPAWMAWEAGRKKLLCDAIKAWAGRGYSVNVITNHGKYIVRFEGSTLSNQTLNPV